MATETLLPDALLENSGWGSIAFADIDEDPDSPDGNWAVASSNNNATIARVSFPTPTGNPVGIQTFKMYVRQFSGTQSGTPQARIDLYENGSLLASGTDQDVTSTTGQMLSQDFDLTGITLADPTGASIEARFVGTQSGGSPGARNSTDLGAINWDIVTYGLNSDVAFAVYATGSATDSDTRDCRVEGASPSSEPQVSWLQITIPEATSVLQSSDTRDVRVTGKADSDTARDARVTGFAHATSFDSFTRTRALGDGWGATTSGHVWTHHSNLSIPDSSKFGVNGSAGYMQLSAANTSVHANLRENDATLTDVDVLIKGKLGTTPTGTRVEHYVIARMKDDDEYYALRLYHNVGDTSTLRLTKRNVTTTDFGSSVSIGTLVPEAWYWFRFRVVGTTLEGKVWADGSGEPSSWQVTATDSDFASGGVGVRGFAPTGNTNLPTLEWDDLQVKLPVLAERDVRTRGTLDSSDTRDVRVRGTVDSDTTRDVRVRGTADSAEARDARVTGKADSTVDRDVRVTGKADSDTTRDARVRGQADSDTARDTRVTGQATATEDRNVRVTGQADSSVDRDVRTTGAAGATASERAQDARVRGQADSDTTRDVRARGELTTAESRDVRVRGQADSSRTQDVRITGAADSSTTRDARATGKADSSLAQDVRTFGHSASSTDVAVRVTGVMQVIRPTSDITAGAWGVAPLYQKLDEVTPDDGDYVSTTSSSTMEVRYAIPASPEPGSSYVRYRLRKSDNDATVDYTVTLLDGATQIDQWTHNNVGTTWTTYTQTVTISNYGNLRLRVQAVIT
jgi:hypothetical protein